MSCWGNTCVSKVSVSEWGVVAKISLKWCFKCSKTWNSGYMFRNERSSSSFDKYLWNLEWNILGDGLFVDIEIYSGFRPQHTINPRGLVWYCVTFLTLCNSNLKVITKKCFHQSHKLCILTTISWIFHSFLKVIWRSPWWGLAIAKQ
jgi:hypothetical protein